MNEQHSYDGSRQAGPTMGESESTAAILGRAAESLSAAGVETPRFDARLLLAEAYGMSLGEVDKSVLLGTPLAGADTGVSADADTVEDGAPRDGQGAGGRSDTDEVSGAADDLSYQRFQSMLTRRSRREPLQYIVGHAPFRYLDLAVGPGVFIPRPETETVVQAAIDWIGHERLEACRLVDLCAGSGAIGLALATEIAQSEVWAVELSKHAWQWAERNRRMVFATSRGEGPGESGHRGLPRPGPYGNGTGPSAMGRTGGRIESSYHLLQADATSMDTLAELDGTIDAVVSNPPYIPLSAIPEQPEVRDYDPTLALYGGSADGMTIPERIIARAFRLLRSGGILAMEHDISQGDGLVAFARAHGFAQARTGDDLTGRPRYLFAVKGR